MGMVRAAWKDHAPSGETRGLAHLSPRNMGNAGGAYPLHGRPVTNPARTYHLEDDDGR